MRYNKIIQFDDKIGKFTTLMDEPGILEEGVEFVDQEDNENDA